MWLASIVSCLALSTLSADAARAVRADEPIATRQHLFAIPFRVARADHPSRDVREVHLYVSGDRGATWQFYNRADPHQRQFLFRAACDGEFWFAVRVVDQSGQARPDRITAPEMRVRVDTVPPQLDLAAKVAEDGAISVDWQIDESLVDPDSLKLMFRAGADGPWQPVALDTHSLVAEGRLRAGSVSWLAATAGDIQVRAEVSDAAGNPAVSHAQVRVPAREVAAVADSSQGWRPRPAADQPATWPAEQYPEAGVNVAATAPMAPASPSVESYVPAPVSPPVARDASPPADIRWVQSRRFELEYDVDPQAGFVQRVELWGTVDEGRTWRVVAIDEDRQSPIAVQVDAEGVYGFRLVIQQSSAPPAGLPQPGDKAELLVGVNAAGR